MLRVKKILDRAEVIYQEKLENVESELRGTRVRDKKFDKLLSTYSNLISLMMQKAEFDRRYIPTDEELKEMKKEKKNKKEKETK